MKEKLSVGDRVMHNHSNQEGVIVEKRRFSRYGYRVKWDGSQNEGGWYVAGVLMKLDGSK